MTKKNDAKPKPEDRQAQLTVNLTVPELSALSHAAVVVTSALERGTVNAAERGLKKVREAAAKHPDSHHRRL